MPTEPLLDQDFSSSRDQSHTDGIALEPPRRVQLSRTKGWRMPPNTVKVDRSTTWGNPFVIGETYPVVEEGHHEPIDQSTITDAAEAVWAFRGWCEETMVPFGDLEPLRGKNLACWCKPDAPCHADVLLEIANAPSSATLNVGDKSRDEPND